MSIKLEKRRYLLAAIANALQTASESISLVRDAADEKEPFEKSLDYLWNVVGELKPRVADNTDEYGDRRKYDDGDYYGSRYGMRRGSRRSY